MIYDCMLFLRIISGVVLEEAGRVTRLFAPFEAVDGRDATHTPYK